MNGFKSIAKSMLLGFLWAVIGSLLAFGIESFTSYTLRDILFIEGLVLFTTAILASITGASIGVILDGFGQENSQYMIRSNLEASVREEKTIGLEKKIKSEFSTVALILGGIFCIIMNFMI